MKKIFFTLFVALVCTAQGFARDFEVDGIYYNLLGGDSVEVTSSRYGHNPGSVTIPETVVYNSTTYRVTTIGQEAFSGCSSLTAVTIPNSVTTIGSSAFGNCSSLTVVTIPNSVTTIGEYAFLDCPSLTSITIPNSVTTIGDDAFRNCSSLTAITWNAKNCKDFSYSSDVPFDNIHSQITSFTFGNEVEHIPAYLCYGMSNLTSITIPNSVTTIGKWAFGDCSSLTAPVYNAHVFAFLPTSYSGTYTIPDGITSIASSAFYDCSSLTAVTIPNSVTTIGSYAFGNCPSLTSITIPNSVTTIGSYAFGNCPSLTSITIPNSVTTIGNGAFEGCSSLTAVTIGTGLETLGSWAFGSCSSLTKFICNSTKNIENLSSSSVLFNKQLDTIIAPANLFDLYETSWSNLAKSIRHIQVNSGELTTDAFGVINRSFDKLQTLDIAATSNTEIANNAFKGCYKLETLLLPTQLERIGYMAVADCKNLQAIDIPATVTDIDDSAFENCRSMETLTFGGQQPASAPACASEETRIKGVSTSSALRRIGNWAFYNCHELQHLEIPEGVTEIGAAAFYGCTYLEDLTLPASVQSIGDNCFALCSKLNKITCLATVPPTIEAKTFYDVNRTIPLYVPEASINDYANDTYWGEFINPQAAETPDGVDNILQNSTPNTRKVLHNGTIYILRNGEKYTIDGRKVE